MFGKADAFVNPFQCINNNYKTLLFEVGRVDNIKVKHLFRYIYITLNSRSPSVSAIVALVVRWWCCASGQLNSVCIVKHTCVLSDGVTWCQAWYLTCEPVTIAILVQPFEARVLCRLIKNVNKIVLRT